VRAKIFFENMKILRGENHGGLFPIVVTERCSDNVLDEEKNR
jgi:hypothetical protein